jgi:hypothetical protein
LFGIGSDLHVLVRRRSRRVRVVGALTFVA